MNLKKSCFAFAVLLVPCIIFCEDLDFQIKSLPYDMMQIQFVNRTDQPVALFLNAGEVSYEIPGQKKCETVQTPIREPFQFSVTFEFMNGEERTFWFRDTDHWFNIEHYYYFIIDDVDDIWYFEDRSGKKYEEFNKDDLFSSYSQLRWSDEPIV